MKPISMFLVLAGTVTAACAAVTSVPKPESPSREAAIAWHDVTAWGVEGRLWQDEERLRWFDRFPAAAENTVPPAVWKLSRDSTGMLTRFTTDADRIRVRTKVLKPGLAMPHMPATGVSGLDLYARDDAGRWRWVAATKPEKQEYEVEIVAGLAAGSREYLLYLPLYNGVESLEIGVPAGVAFKGLAPRPRPIVFYGTSITHGACASRPGMAHVAILGRRLDRPVANLGFSGNGKMDAAVGDLLATVDASCYVIDCVPNMNAQLVAERCVPLVTKLRQARPRTPIVLVEDRRLTNEWIMPSRRTGHDANHAALREAFTRLERDGIGGLFYLSGDGLLGDDAEATVDSSHPNDLGFVRQADAFEPVLRQALAHGEQGSP